MTQATARRAPRITDVIRKLGRCLELVAIDPHFHDITVGLYVKDGITTVWTYSALDGADERVRQIRDLLIVRGGLVGVEGTNDQARFDCGGIHERALGFLITNCVEKSPDMETPTGPITVRDFRSKLTFSATPVENDGRWLYEVTAVGEAPRPEIRIRAVVGGFMRYGEMERVTPSQATFDCGARHDELVRLLIPTARNVSSVEDQLEADAMRGQMTTQTLGFSTSP